MHAHLKDRPPCTVQHESAGATHRVLRERPLPVPPSLHHPQDRQKQPETAVELPVPWDMEVPIGTLKISASRYRRHCVLVKRFWIHLLDGCLTDALMMHDLIH